MSGSDCDTAVFEITWKQYNNISEIHTKIENNNGPIWQLSDKPFGGENDDRKWYIISR